jgi:hypothetical protein
MHQQLTLFERLVQPIRNCAYCGSMVPRGHRPGPVTGDGACAAAAAGAGRGVRSWLERGRGFSSRQSRFVWIAGAALFNRRTIPISGPARLTSAPQWKWAGGKDRPSVMTPITFAFIDLNRRFLYAHS